MPAAPLYQQIEAMLGQHLPQAVSQSSRERLALLVSGIIKSKSASPARVARALETLGLSQATAESIERRIRRIENDPC